MRVKVQKPKPARAAVKTTRVPADLSAALTENTKARRTLQAFSPSHKREYVEWITDAKTGQTRARRIQTAVEQMAEGKPRHWKYRR
jgi:uncharacterized protein YdeI (YjbR/CyaY-like superfamily)